MRSFVAIALNGFREARRNRVTVVVALFAALLILSSTLLANATVATLHRTLLDVGLGAMSLLLVLLTVFLSSSLMSREIERRTIFLIVSKPLSRGVFLTARFAGNMLTVAFLLVLMCLIFVGELAFFGVPRTGVQLLAMGMLFLELLLVAAVGVAISSFSSQLVSLFVTVAVYLAGHLSSDIYKLAERAKEPVLKAFGKAVYYVVPNLERLNFRPHAALALTPTVGEVMGSIGYAMAYSAALLVLAVLLFQRRDFK